MTNTQWEYAVLFLAGDLQVCLNRIGEDRWEMCGIIASGVDGLGPKGEPVKGTVIAFKRPKSLIEVARPEATLDGPFQ